jgi:hypothetical protein
MKLLKLLLLPLLALFLLLSTPLISKCTLEVSLILSSVTRKLLIMVLPLLVLVPVRIG